MYLEFDYFFKMFKLFKRNKTTDEHKEEERLKKLGDFSFKTKHYETAANFYTKIIVTNPSAHLFTNRALCRLKLHNWKLASEDCLKSLIMQPTNIKGHFLLGVALLESKYYEEAIQKLEKAKELSITQKKNYGKIITKTIKSANLQKITAEEESRAIKEAELLNYLTTLVTDDFKSKIPNAKNGIGQNETLELDLKYKKYIGDLTLIFEKSKNRLEIPEYLLGKIYYGLLKNPVISPSGITYDRKEILECLESWGNIDPFTRVELNATQLIPNNVMKEVVDNFKQEKHWPKFL